MCLKWTLDMLVILHCHVVSSLLCPTEGLTTVSVELVRVYPGVDRARSCTGLFSCQCCVESSLLDMAQDCPSRLFLVGCCKSVSRLIADLSRYAVFGSSIWWANCSKFQVFRFFSRSERNKSEIFASAGMRTGWSSSSTLQEMLKPPCTT